MKPKDRRIGWWEWDKGSLTAPVRVDATDESRVYRAPRILLDWNDPYAPRRLYYFGTRISWTLALGPDARSQAWSWRHRWWTMRWRPLVIFPTRYRQIARKPPWMQRTERAVNNRPRPTNLDHLVTTRFTDEEWRMLVDAVEDLDRSVTWYVRRATLDAARRRWTGTD